MPQQFLLKELPAIFALRSRTLAQPVTLQLLVPGHIELRTHYKISAQSTTSTVGLSPVSTDVSLTIGLPELVQLKRGSLNWSEAIGLGRVQVFGGAGAAYLLGRLFEGGTQ